MTTPVLIGWIALGLSISALFFSQIMYRWDMYWVRRHSARFEMFAVRDGFVQLLADGEAEETDVTWGAPYYTINSLLELQRNHSVWMQLGDFLKHSKRMKRDRRLREAVDEVTRAIRERAASDPRYADLMARIDDAYGIMVQAQIHWWDRIAIRLLAALLAFAAMILRPLAGKSAKESKRRNAHAHAYARPSKGHRRPQTAADCAEDSARPLDWYTGVSPATSDQLVGWRSSGVERQTVAA